MGPAITAARGEQADAVRRGQQHGEHVEQARQRQRRRIAGPPRPPVALGGAEQQVGREHREQRGQRVGPGLLRVPGGQRHRHQQQPAEQPDQVGPRHSRGPRQPPAEQGGQADAEAHGDQRWQPQRRLRRAERRDHRMHQQVVQPVHRVLDPDQREDRANRPLRSRDRGGLIPPQRRRADPVPADGKLGDGGNCGYQPAGQPAGRDLAAGCRRGRDRALVGALSRVCLKATHAHTFPGLRRPAWCGSCDPCGPRGWCGPCGPRGRCSPRGRCGSCGRHPRHRPRAVRYRQISGYPRACQLPKIRSQARAEAFPSSSGQNLATNAARACSYRAVTASRSASASTTWSEVASSGPGASASKSK